MSRSSIFAGFGDGVRDIPNVGDAPAADWRCVTGIMENRFDCLDFSWGLDMENILCICICECRLDAASVCICDGRGINESREDPCVCI